MIFIRAVNQTQYKAIVAFIYEAMAITNQDRYGLILLTNLLIAVLKVPATGTHH